MQCEICGKPVASKRVKTCSARCGGQLAAITRGQAPWTREEEEFVAERIGALQTRQIWQSHCRAREERGWPERSYAQMRSYTGRLASNLGVSRDAEVDHWTLNAFARIMGVTRERVNRWRKLGLKIATIDAAGSKRKLSSVSRRNFKPWARQHPGELALLNRDSLLFVLEDPDWVEDILEAENTYYPNGARPVIRSDGQRYETASEAAQKNGVSLSSITQAIKKGYRSSGYKWRDIA